MGAFVLHVMTRPANQPANRPATSTPPSASRGGRVAARASALALLVAAWLAAPSAAQTPTPAPDLTPSPPATAAPTTDLPHGTIYLPYVERSDALAVRVARRMTAMEGRIDDWDWEGGVAMASLLLARESVGARWAEDEAAAWVDAALAEQRVAFAHPNHAAGAWAALLLWERRPEPRYRAIADAAVSFLEHQAPRVDGTLAHQPGELWDDTLFMAAPLLAQYGDLFDRPELQDLAAFEVRRHAERLQDPETGLWYHGWEAETDGHMSGAFWARGNGWAALATSEVYRRLPPGHPERPVLARILGAQLRGLVRVQDGSGLWRTVVTRPDFVLESSGSAAITAALYRAVADGILRRDYLLFADAGATAVRARVGPDGGLRGVSAGTGVAPRIEMYNGVDRSAIHPYGQGLALLMLQAADEARAGAGGD